MADCYTDLEKEVVVLVESFYKYASKPSPVEYKISNDIFKNMVQNELNQQLENAGNRKAAEKFVQKLDANKDGYISFDEYWTLLTDITKSKANYSC